MKTPPSSPLALAVLALLYEEPMHPYRMQQLIKQRGKDEVINVQQRAGLYQTIDRLLRAELIAVDAVVHQAGRPDRTVYALTTAGRTVARQWMHDLLSTPTREFPDFPAALAYLPLLAADEVRAALELRAAALVATLARHDAALAATQALLPRLFLVETEYQRTMVQAELNWVNGLVADLAAGELTWDAEWLAAVAAQFEQTDWSQTSAVSHVEPKEEQ